MLRTPRTLFWVLFFPLLLSTGFFFIFSSVRTEGAVKPVPVAIVRDGRWDGSAFAQVIDGMTKLSGAGLLGVREVGDAAAGARLLRAGEVDGVFEVDGTGEPTLTIGPSSGSSGSPSVSDLNTAILKMLASSYVQHAWLLRGIAAQDPAALADFAKTRHALESRASIRRVSLTHVAPDPAARYFYALLAMATMLAAQLASSAVGEAQPNISRLGARRGIGGISRARQLIGALLGAWTVSFLCGGVLVGYLRLVCGVDFGGRDALCLVAVGVGSLVASAVGGLLGSLPIPGGRGAREAVISAVTLLLSAFTGLYGDSTMAFADRVARAVPLAAWLNPVKLISDVFYSLYCYDALAPFTWRLIACLGWAVVLLVAATRFFRRQRYEHL
ncbi:ABC transporter permease [Coriobacterium glomerans]|nr:ABC transporter permease [Coriobacterium glomerans]